MTKIDSLAQNYLILGFNVQIDVKNYDLFEILWFSFFTGLLVDNHEYQGENRSEKIEHTFFW